MQKFLPCLWFQGNGEEAVEFYCSVLKDCKVISSSRMGEGGPIPAGQMLTAILNVFGHELMILNGGPAYQLSPAASLVIHCDTQDEVDYYWSRLVEGGGSYDQCGWLRDRFGLSWQIVPATLGTLMQAKNPKKAQAVMGAMLKMQKLVIKDLQAAYDSVG